MGSGGAYHIYTFIILFQNKLNNNTDVFLNTDLSQENMLFFFITEEKDLYLFFSGGYIL